MIPTLALMRWAKEINKDDLAHAICHLDANRMHKAAHFLMLAHEFVSINQRDAAVPAEEKKRLTDALTCCPHCFHVVQMPPWPGQITQEMIDRVFATLYAHSRYPDCWDNDAMSDALAEFAVQQGMPVKAQCEGVAA
jgi:hypothetical protein